MATELFEGGLYRDPADGKVYVIQNGAFRHIPNSDVLWTHYAAKVPQMQDIDEAWKLQQLPHASWAPPGAETTNTNTNSNTSTTPNTPVPHLPPPGSPTSNAPALPNGVYREKGNEKIFAVSNGIKHHIPNPDTYMEVFGVQDWQEVEPGALGGMPENGFDQFIRNPPPPKTGFNYSAKFSTSKGGIKDGEWRTPGNGWGAAGGPGGNGTNGNDVTPEGLNNGGFMSPTVIQTDPTPAFLKPLQGMLAQRFMDQMRGGVPGQGGAQNFGSSQIFSQLYGGQNNNPVSSGSREMFSFSNPARAAAAPDFSNFDPGRGGGGGGHTTPMDGWLPGFAEWMKNNPVGLNPPTGGATDAGNNWVPADNNWNLTPQSGGGASDPFNLPTWNGAYSAGLTGGQLDAMQGFSNLTQGSPIAQTINQIMRGGGNTQDLARAFSTNNMAGSQTLRGIMGGDIWQPPKPELSDVSASRGVFGDVMRTGGATPTDLSSVEGRLRAMLSGSPSFSNMGASNAMLDSAVNRANQLTDFSPATNVQNRIANMNVPRSNLEGSNLQVSSAIDRANQLTDFSTSDEIFRSVAGRDLGTSNRDVSSDFFRKIFGGQDVSPGTTNLLNLLTGQLNNSFNAGSYDTSELFNRGEEVFRSDLAREQARIREELSNLGIGPGDSDRLDVLSRNAGDSLARFKLGQEDIKRQSFEDRENRRLAGISAGTGLSQLTELPAQRMMALLPYLMSQEGQAFQEQLAGQDLKLRAGGALADTATRKGAERLSAAELGIRGAGQTAANAVIPFQEAIQSGQLNLAGANSIADVLRSQGSERLAGAQAGISAAGQRAANDQVGFQEATTARQQEMQQVAELARILQIPFDQAMQLTGARMQAAGADAQLAQLPFEQRMQIVRDIDNPQAQRALAAATTQAGMDEAAMGRGMDAEQMMAKRLLDMFSMGESARGVADTDIERRMGEFGRTQGAGLAQILAFMQSQPGLETSIGPSPGSQIGSVIGNLPWAEIIKIVTGK